MFEGCSGCCIAIIVIPLLCCVLIVGGVIFITENGADPPLTDRFRPSQAEADAFDARIDEAVNNARITNQFTITFTERQISSWMALESERFAEDHDVTEFPLDNIQVGLENGEITFYGELAFGGGVDLPVEVVIEPSVDRANHLDLAITSVDFGGLKLPDALVDSVADEIETKMIQPIEELGSDYVVDPNSLRIHDGLFTINGQVLH